MTSTIGTIPRVDVVRRDDRELGEQREVRAVRLPGELAQVGAMLNVEILARPCALAGLHRLASTWPWRPPLPQLLHGPCDRLLGQQT